jgi:hypothetical protein
VATGLQPGGETAQRRTASAVAGNQQDRARPRLIGAGAAVPAAGEPEREQDKQRDHHRTGDTQQQETPSW